MLLRVINDQFTWLQRPEDFSWLKAGEIQADPLSDLRTKENELSLYEYSEEIDLQRIIAAFAAKRKDLDKVDYISFNPDLLKQAGIKTTRDSNGETADEKVNKWHIALFELSSQKIVALASLLLRDGMSDRKFPKDVGALIIQSVKSGWISKDKLGKNIPAGLKKFGLTY